MEPSQCTLPRRELSNETKNVIFEASSRCSGSHKYKTKQTNRHHKHALPKVLSFSLGLGQKGEALHPHIKTSN